MWAKSGSLCNVKELGLYFMGKEKRWERVSSMESNSIPDPIACSHVLRDTEVKFATQELCFSGPIEHLPLWFPKPQKSEGQ